MEPELFWQQRRPPGQQRARVRRPLRVPRWREEPRVWQRQRIPTLSFAILAQRHPGGPARGQDLRGIPQPRRRALRTVFRKAAHYHRRRGSPNPSARVAECLGMVCYWQALEAHVAARGGLRGQPPQTVSCGSHANSAMPQRCPMVGRLHLPVRSW